MKVDVHIRHNKTGRIAIYRDPYNWVDYKYGDAWCHINYMYSEGSYSCD